MNWTPDRIDQFQKALLDAFRSRSELARMVRFELGENLDAIAPNTNLSQTIFTLIQWAAGQGQLDNLLTAARSTNPGNPLLKQFK